MRNYYLGGIVVGVVLFLLSFCSIGIQSCSKRNDEKDRIKYYDKQTVVLRYYMDDDLTTATVYAQYVEKGKRFSLNKKPEKFGFTFAGLYDDPDYETATLYVDANGNSVLTISNDILLYAIFVEGEV